MNILITGGAGYVGTTLIPQLQARGHSVHVLDNLMMGGNQLIPFFSDPLFRFTKGDITDKAALKAAVESVDAIIHLAAIVGYPACRKHPELSQKINVGGMATLLETAPTDVPIIFASTGSTYGKLIGDLCTETTPLNPLTDYGRQKADAEQMLRSRGNFVIFRFATAFGLSSRMRLDLLPNDFTFKAVKDKTLIVYEKNFMRSFIHVRDMGRAFLFALENIDAMRGEAYNVGDNAMNMSKEDICLLIRKHVDYYLHFADVGKDFDQRDYTVSYDKLHALGFHTTITIDQGIHEMVRAFAAVEFHNPFMNV
jgi:nucleoside-diphosphate-sugar epimerase